MRKTSLLEALYAHEDPELIMKLVREMIQLKEKGAKTDAISFIEYCKKQGYVVPEDMAGLLDFFYLVAEIANRISKIPKS